MYVYLPTRPVIIEVPHFASLRGKEREITILRSDNGETWREHTLEATEDAIQEALGGSFEGEGDFLKEHPHAVVGACCACFSTLLDHSNSSQLCTFDHSSLS